MNKINIHTVDVNSFHCWEMITEKSWENSPVSATVQAPDFYPRQFSWPPLILAEVSFSLQMHAWSNLCAPRP